MKERTVRGLPISPGIGIGPPLFLEGAGRTIREVRIPKQHVESEVERYQRALSLSRQEVEQLQRRSLAEGPSEVVEILDAHLQMMQDPWMTSQVERDIRRLQLNTESAFQKVMSQYKEKVRTIEDRYFQERLQDIEGISQRILNYLNPARVVPKPAMSRSSIVLSSELGPLEMVEMSSFSMNGLVTAVGGMTAHPAIIARAKKIPYVANIDVHLMRTYPIVQLIVDGSEGIVILNPEPSTLKKYQKLRRDYLEQERMLRRTICLQSVTRDGCEMRVLANVEHPKEVEKVLKQGAEGVGLFRSEYLYLSRGQFPSEEEQWGLYRRMLRVLQGRPLVIRVFDLGADKKRAFDGSQADSFYFASLGPESNPAMGCRALRFLLRFPSLLETQLRAMLRASVFGEIQILLPMVSDLSELRQVRRLLSKLMEELRTAGIPYAEKVQLGCMIEVPSSAILADAIAREADFLSIGTNDLIQYVMAVDRNNPSLHELYCPIHPSVLRLIRLVVVAAETHGKPLTLCGESAADPKMIPLLLGLGVRGFSVAGRHIGLVKHTLHRWTLSDAQRIADVALEASSAQEIKRLLEMTVCK